MVVGERHGKTRLCEDREEGGGDWVLDWMRRGRWAFGIAGGLIVQTSMMMSVSECFVKIRAAFSLLEEKRELCMQGVSPKRKKKKKKRK